MNRSRLFGRRDFLRRLAFGGASGLLLSSGTRAWGAGPAAAPRGNAPPPGPPGASPVLGNPAHPDRLPGLYTANWTGATSQWDLDPYAVGERGIWRWGLADTQNNQKIVPAFQGRDGTLRVFWKAGSIDSYHAPPNLMNIIQLPGFSRFGMALDIWLPHDWWPTGINGADASGKIIGIFGGDPSYYQRDGRPFYPDLVYNDGGVTNPLQAYGKQVPDGWVSGFNWKWRSRTRLTNVSCYSHVLNRAGNVYPTSYETGTAYYPGVDENASQDPACALARGAWTTIEHKIDMPGRWEKMWVNGNLCLHLTDRDYGWSNGWRAFGVKLRPMWGGAGDTFVPKADQAWYWHNLRFFGEA